MMYLLFAVSALLFILAATFESTLTLWLQKQSSSETARVVNDVFARSIFEGDSLGVSDLGTIMLILSLVAYFSSKSPTLKTNMAYLFNFGIFVAFGVVHGMKWALGRARPYRVMEGDAAYSYWFEPGREFILHVGEGVVKTYTGSFPSGHTATIAALFAGYWVLTQFKKLKILNQLYILIVFALTICMAISRVAVKAHWPTDTMASLLFVAYTAYIFYEKLYFVPKRLENPKTNALIGNAWQFKLLGWVLGGTILFWLSVMTWRHQIAYRGFGFTFAKYSFLLLAINCWLRARSLHRSIYTHFRYQDGTSPHLDKNYNRSL